MMLDCSDYQTQVQGIVTDIRRASPGTVSGGRELSDAGGRGDLLAYAAKSAASTARLEGRDE